MKPAIEHLRNLTDKFRKHVDIPTKSLERMKLVAEAAKKAAKAAKGEKV